MTLLKKLALPSILVFDIFAYIFTPQCVFVRSISRIKAGIYDLEL